MRSSSVEPIGPTLSSGTFVVEAATAGLAAGYVEVAVLAWRRHAGEALKVHQDFAWLTPFMYLAVGVLLGLALAGSARLAPRRVTRRVASFFVFTVFGASLGGLVLSRVHPAAIALVVLGLAAQLSRLTARHPPRRAPALLIAMVALCAVLAAGTLGRRKLDERRARAVLPPAAAGAPNVLLVTLDTVAARYLSLYGYPRPTTPNLDKWGARGVVFDSAFSTAPWTLPSHASLFTGLPPTRMDLGWQSPVKTPAPMLAELLAGRGYAAGAFVAN